MQLRLRLYIDPSFNELKVSGEKMTTTVVGDWGLFARYFGLEEILRCFPFGFFTI